MYIYTTLKREKRVPVSVQRKCASVQEIGISRSGLFTVFLGIPRRISTLRQAKSAKISVAVVV